MCQSVDASEYPRGIRSSIEKLKTGKNTCVDDCAHGSGDRTYILHMYSNVLLTVSHIPTATIRSFRIIYVLDVLSPCMCACKKKVSDTLEL